MAESILAFLAGAVSIIAIYYINKLLNEYKEYTDKKRFDKSRSEWIKNHQKKANEAEKKRKREEDWYDENKGG